MDVEQRLAELGSAMPPDGQSKVVGAHAAAIVDDAQQSLAAAGGGHLDTGSTGIDGILNQFLRRTGRSFDDLAGGDLVDERF
jgi:hypothetical protein